MNPRESAMDWTLLANRFRRTRTYVVAHERLTSVAGDVERVTSIRQVSLSSHAVSVPQFETAKRDGVQLEADLVNEHVRRRDHPRQVADTHVADPPYPLAVALNPRVE